MLDKSLYQFKMLTQYEIATVLILFLIRITKQLRRNNLIKQRLNISCLCNFTMTNAPRSNLTLNYTKASHWNNFTTIKDLPIMINQNTLQLTSGNGRVAQLKSQPFGNRQELLPLHNIKLRTTRSQITSRYRMHNQQPGKWICILTMQYILSLLQETDTTPHDFNWSLQISIDDSLR